MEWGLFRGRRLATSVLAFTAFSQSLFASVPSFEFWWVDPHIELPKVSYQDKLGTQSWSAGPLRASVKDLKNKFAIDQIAIAGNQVRFGFTSAHASSPEILLTGRAGTLIAPLI